MNLRQSSIRLALPVMAILTLASCEDEVSPIGGSLVNNEVQIHIDSTVFKIPAKCVYADYVDARSIYTQLGRISIDEYGTLQSDYVTQLLAAGGLNVPDSIGVDRVDSTKLVITVPRKNIIGDSLAPQQLTVYRLTKGLPSDIKSSFNPEGYYNASQPINSKNYILSSINLSDSAFFKNKNVAINVNLPKQWGRDAFNAYRSNNTDIFQWPQAFCKEFPGLYVKSSFGRGAIANVASTKVMIYYHYYAIKTVIENDEAVKKQVVVKDSVALFSSAPEVIGSSLFRFTPSASLKALAEGGHNIITAPLGYTVDITFPANELLGQYWAAEQNLSVINNLTMTLPATAVANSYGLLPPPELLMIKKSEIESFFAEGKIPDDLSSFRGTYNSSKGRYEFSSMRKYIVKLLELNGSLKPEDLEFTLLPVNIETETVTQSDGSKITYVTSCTPYLKNPAMTEIFTDRAGIVFTYTRQLIK
ncbi:MAG: DUF4270 domain-containing protein [Muribaculaceae bacterium]|nr:DUF4270 domain-containing protein [Muribaculaceae bacterium]